MVDIFQGKKEKLQIEKKLFAFQIFYRGFITRIHKVSKSEEKENNPIKMEML